MSFMYVRNDANSAWVDFCKSVWRARNDGNNAWQLMEKGFVYVRNEANTGWYRIWCGEPCGKETKSGGKGTTLTIHNLGINPGIVRVDYDMYRIKDQMDVFYGGSLVATTGGLISGKGTLSFIHNPNIALECAVRMSAPNTGTLWVYTVNCPV